MLSDSNEKQKQYINLLVLACFNGNIDILELLTDCIDKISEQYIGAIICDQNVSIDVVKFIFSKGILYATLSITEIMYQYDNIDEDFSDPPGFATQDKYVFIRHFLKCLCYQAECEPHERHYLMEKIWAVINIAIDIIKINEKKT